MVMQNTLIYVLLSAVTAAASLITTAAPSGKFTGVYRPPTLSENGVVVYKGIKFGVSRRFEAPYPAPYTISNSTDFGPVCAGQDSVTLERSKATLQVEDCLYLNIYSPFDSQRYDSSLQVLNTSYNVAVYIHGGGFMHGASNENVYHGDYLAAFGGNTIVVTFNYRLGALGFLGGVGNLTGNYGIMDQQLALRWVQENIESFGGDRRKVTLFGQSAGAVSVLVHLVSPLSTGLFARVIIQSTIGLHFPSLEENRKKATIVAHSLLCFVDDAECLKSRSLQHLIDVSIPSQYVFDLTTVKGINFLPWMPTIDGTILPDNPVHLIESGQIPNKDVTVIIGSLLNETALWLPYKILPDLDLAEEAVIEVNWGSSYRSQIKSFYQSRGYNEPWARLEAILTDSLFTCHARRIASALPDVSLYHYQYAAPLQSNLYDVQMAIDSSICTKGACHASELEFIFHTADLTWISKDNITGAFNEVEDRFSKDLMSRWLSLFNHDEAVDRHLWPRYSTRNRVSTAFNIFSNQLDADFSKLENDYRSEFCVFWNMISSDSNTKAVSAIASLRGGSLSSQ